MIKIIRYCFLFATVLVLTSCGTREYLGFEKKKIRLKGERVSILKELTANDPTEKKSSEEIILEDAIVLSNWPQSYNSPTHLSVNHISDSKLLNFKHLVSGASERKSSKILSQPVIYNDLIFFLDAIIEESLVIFSVRKSTFLISSKSNFCLNSSVFFSSIFFSEIK